MTPGELLCAGRKELNMSNRRRTADEVNALAAEVKALRDEGLPHAEIGKKLGLKTGYVEKLAVGANGGATNNLRKKFLKGAEREARDAKVVAYWQETGASITQVAQHFGHSYEWARLIIRDFETGGAARAHMNAIVANNDKRRTGSPGSRAKAAFRQGFARTDIHETDEDNLRAMQKVFRVAKWANYFSGADQFDADFIEVDHIVPVSAGGGHTLENIQIIRRGDHLAKTRESYLCQKDDCMNLTPGEDYMHCRPCSWNDHVLQREFRFDDDGDPIVDDAA